ncbi:hypothetical protein CCO02nite_01840 [Cellulomonas composti]|uniref:Uncharacterized protein n=1 Tax=Cellulomonas composti TaxID=266130 RepID=A0A511J698_9CELL|nr:hypothetical protein CCO02nite_01840 [Cellulomonas composti]
MFFWLWTVLVVGTLVGAFFLARRLWRSALALGRELARATEVSAELAQRVDELQAIAAASRVPIGPTLFADPEPLRARREELRAERAGRRARRLEVARGWRVYWT